MKYERVGDLVLNVRENDGETFYNLESIFAQSGKAQYIHDEQTPIKLDCRIIFGYRFTGYDFIQFVFADEKGLEELTAENVKCVAP